MNATLKVIFQKMARSSSPIIKVAATLLRLPIKFCQLQLLYNRKNRESIDLIKKIQKEKGFIMWPDEMFFICQSASLALKLNGDFVEVGVFRGGSAKAVCEVKGDRPFHLFDTFEGLPATLPLEQEFMQGQYAEGLGPVKRYLENYKNLFFYKGIFPKTSEPVKDKLFAFAHLDVDLYSSTLECLKFFYPRMVKGGCIISHDYSTVPGVRKAFTEYFSDKAELVIELPTSQCVVIKL